MQDIWNSSQWNTSPKAYWTMQYEYKRSGADMQYRFYWKVWVGSGSWYYDGLKLKLFLNGVQHDITVKTSQSGVTGWSYDGTTEWYTVSNKTSGTVPFYAQLYNTNTNTTKATSSTYQLNISPSGATITFAPDFNDEENPTIQYSNLSGNNVTSLQACISLDGKYANVSYRDIPKTGTTYTFVLDEAERKALRSATTGNSRTVIFFIVTVIDGVTFTSTETRKYSIVNGNPIFMDSQISYADTSVYKNTTGNPQQIVQNQSNLEVTFTNATAKKEAKISRYDITVNGITKTTTASGTVDFGKINSSSNVEISIKVTDSRGNTATAKKTIQMLEWAEPTYTVSLERLNNYEDETYLTVDAKCSSVNGKNFVRIGYWFKEVGGEYSEFVEIDNNTTETISCDKNKSYIFKVQVADEFVAVNSPQYPLPKGKFPLFIDTEKNAIGINEFPTEGESLRVAGGIAHFEDGVKIGGFVVDYPVEQGVNSMWTYEKRSNGVAECWGLFGITRAEITTAWGYLFETQTVYQANFPQGLFISAPVTHFSVQTATGGVLGLETMGETTKDCTCQFYPVRATAQTIDLIVSIRAIGKWK